MKKQTLKEMRVILKEEGIRGYSKMDRDTLENAIILINKRKELDNHKFKVGETVWINYHEVFVESKVAQLSPCFRVKNVYGEHSVTLLQIASGGVLTQEDYQAYQYQHLNTLYVDSKGRGTLMKGETYYFYIPQLYTVKKGKLEVVRLIGGRMTYTVEVEGCCLLSNRCASTSEAECLSTGGYNSTMKQQSVVGGVGVEIEVGSGLSILKNREYLIEHMNKGYKLVFDYSIGGGYEINSPILQNDFSSLKQLLLDVKSLGGKPRKTCGIHVHCDCTGYSAKRLFNIIQLYTAFSEKAFKHFIPKHRWGNTYCASYKNNKNGDYIIEDLQDSILHGYSPASCKEYACGYDRYMDVNLKSYYEHNTVEFRQFQCTLEYEEIIAWIEITKAIVDLSEYDKEVVKYVNKKILTFQEMCDILRLSQKTINSLNNMNKKLKDKGELYCE